MGDSANQGATVGELDERFARLYAALVIFGQPPSARLPDEALSHHPSAELHQEPAGAWLPFDNLELPAGPPSPIVGAPAKRGEIGDEQGERGEQSEGERDL